MKRLVAQYQEPLLAFFTRRIENYWDAEELTQEVFCKLLKRDDVEVQENQEAYLFTVAWSVLRDRVRHDQVRHLDSHVFFDEDLDNPDPVPLEQVVDGQDLYDHFLARLDRLHAKTRDIFFLSRYEGFTYTQIADQYGMSESAVEKHIMRALACIKVILKE